MSRGENEHETRAVAPAAIGRPGDGSTHARMHERLLKLDRAGAARESQHLYGEQPRLEARAGRGHTLTKMFHDRREPSAQAVSMDAVDVERTRRGVQRREPRRTAVRARHTRRAKPVDVLDASGQRGHRRAEGFGERRYDRHMITRRIDPRERATAASPIWLGASR